jgi:hypothetical protein
MSVSNIGTAPGTDVANFGPPFLVVAAAVTTVDAKPDGNVSDASDLIGPVQAATAPGTALKVDVIA